MSVKSVKSVMSPLQVRFLCSFLLLTVPLTGWAVPNPTQELPKKSSGLLCKVIQDERLDSLRSQIASANGLKSEDIQLRISHPIKCFVVEILFRKLPVSGGYDLSMITWENVSEKAGVRWDGAFSVDVRFPGGDVTGIIANEKIKFLRLIKTADVPVTMKPGIRKDHPVTRLTVQHFSMPDLASLKTVFPVSPYWKEYHNERENRTYFYESQTEINVLEPAGGVLDWRVIASFPKTGVWKFTGITKAIGMRGASPLICDRLVFPENAVSVIEIPAGIKCASGSGSPAQCGEFRRKADKDSVQWLTVSDWHDALGFPNLTHLTISDAKVNDWSFLQKFPKLKDLLLIRCEVSVPEKDPGMQYLSLKYCQFPGKLEKKMESWYRISKHGGLFNWFPHSYFFYHR